MNDNGEDALIWQYRAKPKARQTVGLLLSETKTLFQTVLSVAELLNVDKSTGYGLDLIGRHVGIERTFKSIIPKNYFGWDRTESAQGFGTGLFYRSGDALNASVLLSDEDFRFFIKAKIVKNYQSPDVASITSSLRNLLGRQAFVIDNGDMTMNIVIPDTYLTDFRLYAIRELDILVRPIGVGYKFLIITDAMPFGWSSDDNAFAFNTGVFTRLINVNH